MKGSILVTRIRLLRCYIFQDMYTFLRELEAQVALKKSIVQQSIVQQSILLRTQVKQKENRLADQLKVHHCIRSAIV